MSTFAVDARSLLAVRDTLGRLHEQLLSIPRMVSGLSGGFGGLELEDDLQEFCGAWHHEVSLIADHVVTLMQRLTQAAVAYERIEQRVAAAGRARAVSHRGQHPAHQPRHKGSTHRGTSAGSGSGTTVIGGGGSSGGSGSGTTVIGGGGSSGGSGSGTTVIGGGGSSGGSGSGTTVIDEKRAGAASGAAQAPRPD